MANLQANSSRDASKVTLAGSSEVLFPPAPFGSIQERFVHNASASNPLAIRLVNDGVAAVAAPAALNTAGSITIPAGGSWVGSVCNAINVIGTAGQPVTAGER